MKIYNSRISLLLIASIFAAFAVHHYDWLNRIYKRLHNDRPIGQLNISRAAEHARQLRHNRRADDKRHNVEGPTTTTAPPSGGFDAGSFVGGIALGAGLVALGLFAFTFYKRRTGRSYQRM
uniref:Secreted protein n=1 Tax=Macrostomum lignano TaxID=282301 RepID=A0A1I8GAX9_9PLAT